MKKIFTFIITAILALNAAVVSQASPAYPYPIKYTQPDGSVITIQKHGDEFYHWITDESGNEIVMDESGFYHKVTNPPTPEMKKLLSASSRMRADAEASPSLVQKTGSPNFLVILIAFKNKPFTHTADEFKAMLNAKGYKENNAIGSAADYFEDNSNGIFRPVFDVYGPVTLDQDYKYYGGNDDTPKADDLRPGCALIDACVKLDNDVNFAQYDSDNNGVIDNVFFYFAGNNEAEGGPDDTIWPHKWNIPYGCRDMQSSNVPGTSYTYSNIRFDGKKFDVYACTSELRSTSQTEMCGIGTFCHEFSHSLGLPDYYDTDYSENGLGDGLFHYSVMSSGNYNGSGRIPPYYTSIDKVKIGWTSWSELQSGQSYTLNDSNRMTAYRTILSSSGSDEYFAFDAKNGQKWDSPLPTGLLIYHVRESRFDNEKYRNKYENNPGIYFKAAYPSSLNPPHASEANVPYPGPYNVTSFDNNSPSPATDWSGKWHGDALSDIKYNGTKHEVTFTYTKKDPNAKTLSGKVTDYTTGAAISGASIKVDYIGGSKSTTTSSDGSYSFYFGSINNPAFSVSISKSGYLSLDNDAFTHPGGDYIKDFTLIPSSAATDGLELKRYRTPSSGYIHGITNATDVIGCIKFSSAEMKPFVGMKITEISFKVYGNPSNECAVAWFGAEQVLNQSVNHVGGEFNTVMVNNGGLTIPEGKDIYVGYSISGVELPYIWDETTTNNDGCYVRKITESSWTNWSDKGSLLISFKVQENSQVEHDIMYELGYSGLNLEPGKTYTRPSSYLSSATKIDLSMAESSDPIKSVTYYFDNKKQSGESISIGYNTSKGDHTIKAEVVYESGKTETIIQVINVQ